MSLPARTRCAARLAVCLTLLGGSAMSMADFELQPATPLGTAAASDTTVYLAVGSIDTRLSPATETLGEATANADLGARHVLQLDGPMTADRRLALEEAGVVVRDYLPINSFIVELAGADADAVAELGFVRWHGAFQNEWKISPEVQTFVPSTNERQQLAALGREALIVTLFEGEDPDAAVDAIFDSIDSAQVYYANMIGPQGEISVAVDTGNLDKLAEIPAVQFVEPAPEISFRNSTLRWIGQSNVNLQTPVYDAGIIGDGGTTGTPEIIAVVDGRIDQNHCSFGAGKIVAYNASAGSDDHGTHVAGTAAGNNGVDNDTRGMAYGANIAFDTTPSFTDTAFYNTGVQHHNQGARIHTNSWGDDSTTAYNSLARGVDRFMYDFEESLVLFAVTNTSTLRNPDNAKNLLACGATSDTPSQAFHCTGGIGPTSDGRRKPEVYLPGCGILSSRWSTTCSTVSLSGTSMATPAIAGCSALVRQYYREGFYPSGLASSPDALIPSGALIKATVVNSTVDMTGVSGYPSNLEGWGRVLLDNALYFDGDTRTLVAEDVRNADGLSTGEQAEIAFDVADSGEPLKVVLAWTEPPASASTGSAPAWINDLNLELVAPDGTTTYLGNNFAVGQSTPGGLPDDRNNLEVCLINTPSTGAWTARIVGNAINQGTQGYALVATGAVSLGPAPLRVRLDSPNPMLVALDTDVQVDAQIDEGDDALVSNTVNLFYSTNGVDYQILPMGAQGGGIYSATIPGFDSCDDIPSYYISAEGVTTGVVTLPPDGPAGPFTFPLGEISTAFADEMEGPTDNGWTVGDASDTATSGVWNRMDPEQTANGGVVQPEDDFTPAGTECWVTDGFAGASVGSGDVDGGSTTLYSPIFDLAGLPGATASYARWYSNSAGGDPNNDVFVVEITDDGSTWVNVETVGPSGSQTSGGWNTFEFNVEDLVSLTNNVQLRFIATDNAPGSLVEAAVDDLSIITTICESVPSPCVGDVDGDGDTDVFDFSDLAAAFGSMPGDANWNPGADLNSDSAVDVFDFSDLTADFGCQP